MTSNSAVTLRLIDAKERVEITFPIGVEHAAERRDGCSYAGERRNEALGSPVFKLKLERLFPDCCLCPRNLSSHNNRGRCLEQDAIVRRQ